MTFSTGANDTIVEVCPHYILRDDQNYNQQSHFVAKYKPSVNASTTTRALE